MSVRMNSCVMQIVIAVTCRYAIWVPLLRRLFPFASIVRARVATLFLLCPSKEVTRIVNCYLGNLIRCDFMNLSHMKLFAVILSWYNLLILNWMKHFCLSKYFMRVPSVSIVRNFVYDDLLLVMILFAFNQDSE